MFVILFKFPGEMDFSWHMAEFTPPPPNVFHCRLLIITVRPFLSTSRGPSIDSYGPRCVDMIYGGALIGVNQPNARHYALTRSDNHALQIKNTDSRPIAIANWKCTKLRSEDVLGFRTIGPR